MRCNACFPLATDEGTVYDGAKYDNKLASYAYSSLGTAQFLGEKVDYYNLDVHMVGRI